MNENDIKINTLYEKYKTSKELLQASNKDHTPEFIKELDSFKDLKELNDNSINQLIELIDLYIDINKKNKYAFKNFIHNDMKHNLLSFFMLNYTTNDRIKDHIYEKHNIQLNQLSESQQIQFLTYFIGGDFRLLNRMGNSSEGDLKVYPDMIKVRHKRYNLGQLYDLKKYGINENLKYNEQKSSILFYNFLNIYMREGNLLDDDKFAYLFKISNIPLYAKYDKKNSFSAYQNQYHLSLSSLNQITSHFINNESFKNKDIINSQVSFNSYYLELRRHLSPENNIIKEHCEFFINEYNKKSNDIDTEQKFKLLNFYNYALFNERINDNFYDDYHLIAINLLDYENLKIYKESIDGLFKIIENRKNYENLYDKVKLMIDLKIEKHTLLNSISTNKEDISIIKKRL